MTVESPSRRREIEHVASALFRDRGYTATSVRDIARALDIRGPSLYSHVTSKEDVLWSIVDRAASRFERAADDALGALRPAAGAAERLAALVRAHVAAITADPELAGVFVHEWRHLSGDRRVAILERRDAYERRFRDVIAAGMADGDLLPTDPAMAAAFILAGLNGLAAWYRPEGRLPADRLADHYAGFALGALTSATDGGFR